VTSSWWATGCSGTSRRQVDESRIDPHALIHNEVVHLPIHSVNLEALAAQSNELRIAHDRTAAGAGYRCGGGDGVGEATTNDVPLLLDPDPADSGVEDAGGGGGGADEEDDEEENEE
jgi:hypothetical protein